MRTVIAVLLAAHGIAHLPGFIVSWRLASLKDMEYSTMLLGGRFDAGDTGIRVVGILWLCGALMFLLAGIVMMARVEWWPAAVVFAAVFSLILSVLNLPQSRIGIVLNLIVLSLLAAHAAGWFTLD